MFPKCLAELEWETCFQILTIASEVETCFSKSMSLLHKTNSHFAAHQTVKLSCVGGGNAFPKYLFGLKC